MEASPFARLSAELRNEIYTYTLYVPEGVWLKNEKDEEKTKPIGRLRLQAPGNLTAPTMTCRQIHAEAGRLFYSINRFSIRPFSLGPHSFIQEDDERIWLRKFRAWMNTVGSPNASCITKLCLHVRDYHTHCDPADFLDYVIDILPSKRRAWPNSLHLTLNFALEFFDLDSLDRTDNAWVPTSFELPLYGQPEAKHQIDSVFDDKLVRLRKFLKQVEEEIAQEQKEGMEDTSEQLPQILNPSEPRSEERSVRAIKGYIDDVKFWRRHFFGYFFEVHIPEMLDHDLQGISPDWTPEQSPCTSSIDSDSD